MTWTLVILFHLCCSGSAATTAVPGFKTQQACALEAQRIARKNEQVAGTYCVRVS